MWRGQLKYIALWLFLGGLIVIVFIQFISGQNINRLNQGNKRLLKEVKIQNDLRQLEADVLTLESDIRGMIITDDTTQLYNVKRKIINIKNGLVGLDTLFRIESVLKDVEVLDTLINKKLEFSYRILDQFQKNGKDAGEQVINTGRGKILRDSIVMIVAQLDNTRQKQLHLIMTSMEKNGDRARTWGLLLGIIATITCILAFLHMLKQGKQQQTMIVKLNESEKQIRDAAKLKEQFLANMSHEIRTPMNAIIGFTNLLRKTNLDPQQTNYVEFIRSSSDNLLTLINDILDLSKIEAGMMNIENAPFSLNGLVSSVEIIFLDKAKQKGLEFKVQVDTETHDTLSGDAVRLTQILINLLSNAIKFTENGSVLLHAKAIKQTNDEVLVEFRVTDTGIGIAPEKKESIFERFRQAEAETTRRYGGTGLGLSIVKQLVDLLQGSIQLNSEVNAGAEFVVTLPFKPVHNYTAEHAIHASDLVGTIDNMRLLIAEDNQMNQQLLRHLMKQWGIDYEMVNDGEEVLQQLKTSDFSLILMDIQMPNLDGYATTLAIRNDLRSNIPIIAMTAHAMSGEKEKCLHHGMNEYISKPLKESELYRLIQLYTQPILFSRKEENKVIDLTYLHELSGGDVEFENAIISQFILQLPNELELLREAINAKDFKKIKSIAHGMKSSVAYLGLAEKVYPHLQSIEAEAGNNNHSYNYSKDFQQVEIICKQSLEEAKQLLLITA